MDRLLAAARPAPVPVLCSFVRLALVSLLPPGVYAFLRFLSIVARWICRSRRRHRRLGRRSLHLLTAPPRGA